MNEHLDEAVRRRELQAAFTLVSAANQDPRVKDDPDIVGRAAYLWTNTTSPQIKGMLEKAFAG